MEGASMSVLFGGGAILITTLFLFFQGDGADKIKKLFSSNQKELEDKIKNAEKAIEEKKQKVKEIITQAKNDIEETGKIRDPKKLLEEFNKW